MSRQPCPPGLDSDAQAIWEHCRRIIELGPASPELLLQSLRQEALVRQMQAEVACLEAEITRLRLLLIRKNEALSIFADPKCWEKNEPFTGHIWNGDGAGHYRDPMAFAKREAEATEPCDS